MTAIIVKEYAHFNRALPNWDSPKGKWIRSKDHYDREMKKAGMVACDKAIAGPTRREYKLSRDARAIIESAKASQDRHGKVKLSDRTIDAMIKKGAIGKKVPSHMKLPSHYNGQGSFND